MPSESLFPVSSSPDRSALGQTLWKTLLSLDTTVDLDSFLDAIEEPLAALSVLDGTAGEVAEAGPWALRLSDFGEALPALLPRSVIYGDLEVGGALEISLHLVASPRPPQAPEELSSPPRSSEALVTLDSVADRAAASISGGTAHLRSPEVDNISEEARREAGATALHIFACLMVTANLDTSFTSVLSSSTLDTSTTGDADVAAGAAVLFAHHRPVPHDQPARQALADLVRNLSGVWRPRRSAALHITADGSPAEVVESLVTGQLEMRLTATYSALRLRELAGSSLASLRLDGLASLRLAADVGVSVEGRVEGIYRLVATPSHRGADFLRLRLHRHRHRFVQAGLALELSATVDGAATLVDEALERLLELPQQLAEFLRELLTELAALVDRIERLEDNLRATLRVATSVRLGALSLQDLGDLLPERAAPPTATATVPPEGPLPRGIGDVTGGTIRESTALPAALLALARRAQGLLEPVTQRSTDLRSLTASLIEPARVPLRTLHDLISTWLDRYDELRRQGVDFLSRHAEDGARLSLQSTLNRARTTDTLVELEIDLTRGRGLYFAACRGELKTVLAAAEEPRESGVELLGGRLAKTLATRRVTTLDLSLLGVPSHRTLASWTTLTTRQDLASGSLLLLGEAGAELLSSAPRETHTLRFLFELVASGLDTGGAGTAAGTGTEGDDPPGFREPLTLSAGLRLETEVAAALDSDSSEAVHGEDFGEDSTDGDSGTSNSTGSDELQRHHAEIAALVSRHVGGAHLLGVIPTGEVAALQERLLRPDRRTGYRYALDLTIDPRVADRVFQIDVTSTDQARNRLWAALRRAVSALDLIILDRRHRPFPLSAMLGERARRWLVQHPAGNGWTRFRILDAPSELRFADGAHRQAWAYLYDLHRFAVAYDATRDALREARRSGRPSRELHRELRQMAVQTVRPPGAAALRPLDAKFLALALLAGDGAAVRLSFRRGDLTIPF